MKLTKTETVKRTVDWLLNVRDEVDDPVGALEEMVGDRVFAQKVFDNIQALVETNYPRWRRIFGPERGSVSAFVWVREQLY